MIMERLLRNKREIRLYDNILSDHEIINGWRDPAIFPVEKSTRFEKEHLRDLCVLEIVFEGTHGDESIHDALFEDFNSFIEKFVFFIDIPFYLFYSESMPQIKNKIRSYKKILPKKLISEYARQIEIPIKDNYTLISALIKLNKKNFNDGINLLTDTDNSFIVATRSPLFLNDQVLENITRNYMMHDHTSKLNYVTLTKICENGDDIFRVGGDGGDGEVTFQIFCQKKKKDLMVLQIEQLLARM